MIHPKMKILSSFIHLHIFLIFLVEHKFLGHDRKEYEMGEKNTRQCFCDHSQDIYDNMWK